jgi:hypothetical protein
MSTWDSPAISLVNSKFEPPKIPFPPIDIEDLTAGLYIILELSSEITVLLILKLV